jgi:four helix bundle protein
MSGEVDSAARVGGDRPGARKWRRYDPERLAVYRLARAHTRAVAALLEDADARTRGYADLVNQTRRSTASIPANIKEGYGAESPGSKLQYYGYAKASTTETWAHIDTLVDFECLSPASIAEVRDLQNQIIALLVTMIKNLKKNLEV